MPSFGMVISDTKGFPILNNDGYIIIILVFNCEYLLIANCEYFLHSQLIDSQT